MKKTFTVVTERRELIYAINHVDNKTPICILRAKTNFWENGQAISFCETMKKDELLKAIDKTDALCFYPVPGYSGYIMITEKLAVCTERVNEAQQYITDPSHLKGYSFIGGTPVNAFHVWAKALDDETIRFCLGTKSRKIKLTHQPGVYWSCRNKQVYSGYTAPQLVEKFAKDSGMVGFVKYIRGRLGIKPVLFTEVEVHI